MKLSERGHNDRKDNKFLELITTPEKDRQVILNVCHQPFALTVDIVGAMEFGSSLH